MLVCICDLDRLAHSIRFTEEAAEFELDVETAAGTECGDFGVGGGIEEDLAVWTTDGCS